MINWSASQLINKLIVDSLDQSVKWSRNKSENHLVIKAKVLQFDCCYCDLPDKMYHAWNMSKFTPCANRSSHSLIKLCEGFSCRSLETYVAIVVKNSAIANKTTKHWNKNNKKNHNLQIMMVSLPCRQILICSLAHFQTMRITI